MIGHWQARRFALVAMFTVMGLLALPSAAGASGSAESAFAAKLNAERSQRGLPALSVDAQLTQVARDWSDQMVASGGISHRPNLGAVVSGAPAGIGENVGRSALTGATEAQLVDRIHRAFMDSPGHRQNVLGDWTHVGVGVRVTDGGSHMWVTVNFKAVQAPEPQPEPERPAQTSAETAEPAPAKAEPSGPPQGDAEVAGSSGGASDAEDAPSEPAEVSEARAGLVSTARGLLSPAIRAHFSLNDPRPLPRQLAGYLVAV